MSPKKWYLTPRYYELIAVSKVNVYFCVKPVLQHVFWPEICPTEFSASGGALMSI
jgi:hypothetical protein